MNDQTMTLADLTNILCQVAGTSEDVDLNGDVLDVGLDELGYDSVALLEAAGHIERDYGLRLDDDAMLTAKTLRALLEVINNAEPGTRT